MAAVKKGALRATTKDARPTPARSAVGEEITHHLRELQQARRDELSVEGIVAAFVPAIAALAERGLLVSVSLTRDGKSVRLSTLVDKEWIEWYAADDDDAGELGASIVRVVAS